MPLRPHLLGPWRRAFQVIVTALVAVTPFIRINGISLLRLDIPALALELFGHRYRIEELYLAWLFVLCLIFLFILITVVLGRVWCGWACPQTALCDLAEGVIKRSALEPFREVVYLLISLWLGMTFVWYFIPPLDFVTRLMSGALGAWPIGTVVVVALLVMVDLSFVGRLFCRDFCPYGRFQVVLADRGTLVLQAPAEEMRRCLGCNSCLKACPTGIDIRRGYQIECLNCARCLDACRTVMAKQGQEGIIRYTIGQEDLGWGAILTPKSVALALIVVLIAGSGLFLASHRALATFKIGRSPVLASRLTENGRQYTFFSGSITNRREDPQQFRLTVVSQHLQGLSIKGPTRFELAGNEKQPLNLAIDSPILSATTPITFRLETKPNGDVIEVAAYLTPAGTERKNE